MAVNQNIEDLKREVAENKEVMGSAVTLLKNLSQKIQDNINDQAALKQLATDLDTGSTELATAVTENTPVENA
jgi:hypothetical protein